MTVSTCSMTDDGKRKWDKKYFCLYCNEPHHKIARHLERMHAEEAAVAHAISFPKLSKIRSLLLDQLRNKGNYLHNLEVLQSGDGEIVTKKRPSYNGVSVRDYLPCQHCLAFFNKIDLWKHEGSCKARKGPDEKRGGKRVRVQAASSRLLPLPVYSTGGCEEIIHNMNQDDIQCHIKNDPLICKYGNALSAKHGHAKSQFTYISSKMRELARFVLTVNEMDCGVQYLHEVCVPSKFKLAVHAARKMSGHDPTSDRYKTPSLALKIGYSLKRATEIAFGESRMTEDREAEAQAKRFIELLENNWNNCFSGLSLSDVPQFDVSSLTEDLIKLQKFLKVAEDTAKRELLESPTNAVWKKLNETLLAEIALFNRKRTGEVAKMLLETYTNRKKSPASADIFNSLSRLEQELGDDKLTRVEIEGKNGRTMPVLLTARMISSLEILIANRDKVGVSKDNPYVFARSPDAASYVRGSDCLRKFARACDAKNPESLIHATVRKEVAIHCQILNLNESELDQVAKLLGHDTQVHKEYYRLSENAAHLAEISKLLLAMDQVPVVIPGPSEERIVSPTYGTYPAGTDSARTYPSGTYPTGSSYPTGTYSAKSYTVGSQPLRSYHAGTYPSKSYPSGSHSPRSYSAGTDSARAYPTGINPASSYPTVTHPVETYRVASYASGTYLAETHDARSCTEKTQLANACPASPYDLSSPARSFSSGMNPVRSYPAGTYAAQTLPAQTLPARTVIIPTLHAQTLPAQTLPTQTLPVGAVPAGAVPVGTGKSGTVWKQRMWSDAAKAAVNRQMGHFISMMEVPGKRDCEVCLHNEPALRDRTWRDIKNYVHNTVKSIKRKNGLTRVDPTKQTKKGLAKKEKETIEAKSAKDWVGGTMTVPEEGLELGPVATPRKQKIWSNEAQAAVRRQLGDFTKLMKIPGKKECDACLAAEPALQGRTWKDVKNYVHNTLKTMCRRHSSGKQNMDHEKPSPYTQNPGVQQNPWVHQKSGVPLGLPEEPPVYLSLYIWIAAPLPIVFATRGFEKLWSSVMKESVCLCVCCLPQDSSGMSLSMLAAAGGQDDILRLLIKKGVKGNGRQKNGTTALMHAAEKNFLTTVAILLEAGSYVNAQTLGGETALMKACKRGNADVVRLLLEYGADCNILSKHKNTAMHFAKVSNNLLVYELIEDHISMLSNVAENTIRAYFETRLALLEPVFPLACHRLCEGPDFSLEFAYKLSPHTPGEGSGILLFIFHANFLSEITARLCGPCSVHAVILNDKFQLPIFLDSHFIYSFSPVPGINKLFIRLAESPTAKVKLLICAFRVQLQ
ncbi:unnamed protein product [Oncorhynchus mykiss]|uniref:Uncharacterized protein n=1 Tax=Oncorhynchus mykiss TaxID=8022 RepID=A0A060W5R0_ONCMY|nr:unnamed protein product [Oncorhynchus mykiss]